MPDAHANLTLTTVATAPSPATSGTSLVVASGAGANFPAVPFNATIWPTAASPTKANAEIVRVTARSTDTLTITRAQEGTTARTVVVGDQIAATITAKTLTDAETAVVAGFFGEGSDGDATISGTTTLTRDMYYDNLTVANGGTLITAGYRVYCKTSCVVNSGGLIHNNGTAATTNSGAVAGTANSIASGTTGANGGTAAGSSKANLAESLGGAGGTGGTGSSGAGGTATVSGFSATNGGVRALPFAAIGLLLNQTGLVAIRTGNGGGGGGGDTTNSGGGGGGGGGFVIINARSVTNNGTISANGGNGATRATGNVGGGGGGGGGAVIVNCTSYSGSDPTVTGGTHGNGVGTGTNGSDGGAGTVLKNIWA